MTEEFELLLPHRLFDGLGVRPKINFEVKTITSSGVSSSGPITIYEDPYVTLKPGASGYIEVVPKSVKVVRVENRETLIRDDVLYDRVRGTLKPLHETSLVGDDALLRTPVAVLLINLPEGASKRIPTDVTPQANILPFFFAAR